jgi:hypothetical protein
MYVYFTLSALLIVRGCLSVPPRSCTKAVVEEGGRKDFPILSQIPYHDNVLIMGYKGKGHPITRHVGPVGEQKYSSTLPLTSALDGVGSQVHSPAALPPGKAAGTSCIGGWMCPGVGLDGCGKYLHHWDSITRSSSPQRVVIRTELSQPTIMAYISSYSYCNISMQS